MLINHRLVLYVYIYIYIDSFPFVPPMSLKGLGDASYGVEGLGPHLFSSGVCTHPSLHTTIARPRLSISPCLTATARYRSACTRMGQCWPPAAEWLAVETVILAAVGLSLLSQATERVRVRRLRESPPDFTAQLEASRDAEWLGATARDRAVTARGGRVNFFE